MIHACLECAVNPYAQRYTAKKHRGRSWIDTKPQIASCILPVSASTYCCCCWHSFPYHYCLYYRLQVTGATYFVDLVRDFIVFFKLQD